MSNNLIYSAVAKFDEIEGVFLLVSDYPETSSTRGTQAVVKTILTKIKHNSHKQTIQHERVNFHYRVFGEYCYLVVSKPNYPLRICFAFLDAIQTTHARTRIKQFKNLLKEKMSYYNNPKNDKMTNIQQKIDDTKGEMMLNIEKLLDRGEKIDTLTDKTEDLSESAFTFQRKTKTLKLKQIQVFIMIVIIIICALVGVCFIVCIVLLILFLAICPGFQCLAPIITLINQIFGKKTQ